MYEGEINWELVDYADEQRPIWRAYSDVGAKYEITRDWCNFFAKRGDSTFNNFTTPLVNPEEDFYVEYERTINERIPVCGFEVPSVLKEPYWDVAKQVWAYETDTDWVFMISEGYICSREYQQHFEYIGKDVRTFEAAENIIRNDWDTFYL